MKATEPPRVLLYGPEKAGKTTLASEFPAPVFLQTEVGTGKLELDTFGKLTSYAEVMDAIGTLYQEPHDFQTVVVDSVTAFQPLIWAETGERGDDKGNKKKRIEDFGYAQASVEAEKLREEQEYLVDQAAGLNDLGRDVLGGFIRDMQEGVSAAQALENALARVADKLLDMALDALFSPAGSGAGGLVGNILSALGGQPARAGGGPVRGGSAYTVGEQGPETFVPNVSGRILPNHLSAGASPKMNVVINNNAGASVSATQTPGGMQIDINRMVEDAMVNQFQGNGRGAQAAARTYGLRRQTA